MIQADDTITNVVLEVNTISPACCEVKVSGSTIGYVGCDLHCFTASTGTCPESATPRGTFDLWDKAAAELLHATSLTQND
ncbi:MAG TPA: hypothetical protein VGN33_15370 [Leifsonia sp.]|jgi:hypothetical protein|nr:hypothetical protein [Leifsonia sp.]